MQRTVVRLPDGIETVTESDWEWFLTDIIFLGRNSRIFMIGNNLGDRCIVETIGPQAIVTGLIAK